MHQDFKLIFSEGRGFMSRFVAWWLKSKYLSHTVGAFKVFRADVIMESSEKGVEFNTAKNFIGNNTVRAIVRPVSGALATHDGMGEHLSWLIEQFGGEPYDWMAAGSLGVMTRMRWLWNLIGGWLSKRWKNKAVHCTELWVRLLAHAGYKAVKNLQPELTGPPALLKALALRSDEFQIEQIDFELKKELGI
jgi:hypothetical protein